MVEVDEALRGIEVRNDSVSDNVLRDHKCMIRCDMSQAGHRRYLIILVGTKSEPPNRTVDKCHFPEVSEPVGSSNERLQ